MAKTITHVADAEILRLAEDKEDGDKVLGGLKAISIYLEAHRNTVRRWTYGIGVHEPLPVFRIGRGWRARLSRLRRWKAMCEMVGPMHNNGQ